MLEKWGSGALVTNPGHVEELKEASEELWAPKAPEYQKGDSDGQVSELSDGNENFIENGT